MDETALKQKKYFFLRDDDVYDADPCFLKVFWLCARKEIPVIYGVVPKRMTRRLRSFFSSPAVKNVPFDLVQHGWTHRNAGTGPLRYEFGPARAFDEQQKDILRGWRALRDHFKTRLVPAFVPPFHGYDARTLRVMRKSGFRIFSAGTKVYAPMPPSLLSLPAHVGINSYSPEYQCLPLHLKPLLENTVYNLRRHALTGAYFHHSTLKKRKDFRVFQSYLQFLQYLFRNKICQPLLFSDILKHRRYFKTLAASDASGEEPSLA